MQVFFEKINSKDKECAIIKAVEKNKQIELAIEMLEGKKRSIPVTLSEQALFCDINDIFYIESVDKKTFVYTKDNCYSAKYRLYELEDMLGPFFMRCSKSMIINLKKIKSVKSEIGGRMNATLLSKEVIIISRSYVKEMKRRLEL
ncbi:LytTr DNA-binding domain-containing protein [Lachnospiraceae bacterium RM5]|nr:LytTr DNA-binding domain-containing protein [Lachnospiraceae bacterium RM5]